MSTIAPTDTDYTTPFDDIKSLIIVFEVLCIIIAILDCVFNIMTIFVIHKHRVLRSIVSNLFVVSMCIANLVLVPPFLLFPIRNHLPQNEAVIITHHILGTWPAYTSSQISLLTITLVSVDRLIAVIKPMAYKTTMTPRFAKIIISVAWIYILFLTGFVMYYGLRVDIDHLIHDKLGHDTWIPNPLWILFLVQTCLCIVSTSVIYMIIYVIVRSRQHVHGIGKVEAHDVRVRRVTKMMGLLVAILLITWLPLHLFAYITPSDAPFYEYVYYSLHLLTTTNTFISPLVHYYQNKKFHQLCQAMMRSKSKNQHFNTMEVSSMS